MSGTMSRSNNQWLQFYENNQPTTVQSWSGDAATDATVVTTTTTSNTNTSSVSNQLSRVTRPTNTRRRSRASRRTPTTLLNTDTTNFRAMVQRFTGGGNAGGGDATSAPFLSNDSSVTSTHQLLNTNYNSNTYDFADGVGVIGSSGSGMATLRPNDGYNLQFRQPQIQPYFTMTVEDGGSTTANDGDDQQMGFRQSGSYNW